MAGQIPDPRTLESWEDAFQHPLPVVRRLEQQLRKNIDDNRSKLRSLVGASYRDLLGTAERIIDMDEQMQRVETNLGEIGQRCNSSTVERMAENQHQMRKATRSRDGEKQGFMAQTKVLQNALKIAARTIKTNGNALLASKLLTLSRLLHKSLSETGQPHPVLEELRRKLFGLRKSLLTYIERTLIRQSKDKTQLAHTLCAYALITTSPPREVLRHFLQVRYEQLDSAVDTRSEDQVLQMLDLYGQTLIDSRELFPRRFADALSDLTKVPLMRDEQVKLVSELNLDIYGSWIAEDIRTFTPWVRNDQLTASEVTNALGSWGEQARGCLMRGLEGYLKEQNSAHALVQSRHKVISKFMALSIRLRSEKGAEAIHQLRKVYLTRLEQLASQTASDLSLTTGDTDGLTVAGSFTSQPSIWNLATEDFDLSDGALKFRQAISRNRHGSTTALQTEIQKLDEWMSRISDFLDLADEIASDRWEDDIDVDLDDLEDGESLREALSEQDSNQLKSTLRGATQNALSAVIETITSQATTTKAPARKLRIWREVDQRYRFLKMRLNVQVDRPSLAELHRNLATSIATSVIEDYTQSAKTPSHIALTLWDGSPPLPIQPSPAVFKFLTRLHRAMSGAGPDLWTSECVSVLKGVVVKGLVDELNDSAFTHPTSKPALTNGHVESNDAIETSEEGQEHEVNGITDSSREQSIQNVFDIYYLQRVFRLPAQQKQEQETGGVVTSILSQLDLDDGSNERLIKSAVEYWKKTYLLFGLLASGSDDSDRSNQVKRAR